MLKLRFDRYITWILETLWTCASFIKHKIRKTVYPILCRFRDKMPWSVRLDSLWSKSFKADLLVFLNLYYGLAAKDNKSTRRNWITTGVSETEVWVRFLSQALSCFVSCEVGTKWESHIFTFFCSNFVGLFDGEGQSHNTVYAIHRFMLGIYCMTVSR